jgi:hypothetical protein
LVSIGGRLSRAAFSGFITRLGYLIAPVRRAAIV